MKSKLETHLDYNKDTEELFIRFFLTFPDLFVRCMGVMSSRHYSDIKHKKAIDFIMSHVDSHHVMPTADQLQVVSGKKFELLQDAEDRHSDWFLKEYEKFARHKELEIEILNSPDLLEQGRYGEVEARIKRAVQMGLVKDLGTDYFGNPRQRIESLMSKDEMIPTGYRDLDQKLHGGTPRGSLNIWVGQSGAGKSLFLQNASLNYVEQGLNVVYVTYELSESLCSMRLDAMVTGNSTRDIFKKLDSVETQLAMYHKKHKGSLQVKQMLNGSNANDLRAYIKEYETETRRKVDVLAVDYLDLMMPYTVKVSAENAFVKDKFISEELRNLAIELNIVLVTASQMNRGSHETNDFGHEHIAGGMSKIYTADNVFAIHTSPAMRESGRYQLQLLKTRSSSGVGSRVDLKFDVTSLRIRDLSEGEKGALEATTASVIEKVITSNRKTVVARKEEDIDGDATLQSGIKLRELLKRKGD